ncbi:anthranilate synthase subunit II [Heyndrickxia shackletonii]|uniref:Anthranilate synthase subunit II n=1 Tax=Heyndrickxia shackletonii TaxID=157838 RepID=A0A0Q3T8N1_9BACI|nr:aminodeoxychorismate/anthranilate synthase component II [Heyndrickxia shackletonii]KQL50336.1 anthranilate synthase subunit II [Heyndrickxia shackletonii]NEZ01622.1 aminodeoxychorismate/anthranilate synthase component II [Heyndrickxia shackletonii]
MILLIDNYDSFTYNLYQYFLELGEDVQVVRNDQITVEDIEALQPEAIILSPGPGVPENAGICMELIKACYREIPILGICLGHQAIGAAFGAAIVQAENIKHGKTSMILHSGQGLFEYMSQPLEVMRYHSLVIEEQSLPLEIEVVANSMDDNEVMGIKHIRYPLYGLQFHPESIGTKCGKALIQNFLHVVRGQRNEIVS